MHDFKAKLGEDGRIIIPAACRKELHLMAGDELILRITDNELSILSAKQAVKNAQQRIQALSKGASLVDKLKALRHKDSQDE